LRFELWGIVLYLYGATANVNLRRYRTDRFKLKLSQQIGFSDVLATLRIIIAHNNYYDLQSVIFHRGGIKPELLFRDCQGRLHDVKSGGAMAST